MKKGRYYPSSPALETIKADTAIVLQHPATEQTQRRLHWRRLVEASRDGYTWALVYQHREQTKPFFGQVVRL